MKSVKKSLCILFFLLITGCASPDDSTFDSTQKELIQIDPSPTIIQPTNTYIVESTIIPTEEPFLLKISGLPVLEIDGFAGGSFINGYAVLDMNNDGFDDLIYSGPKWRNSEGGFVNEPVDITVLLNKGDNRFIEGNETLFPQGSSKLVHARDAKASDFNGDGISDIIFIGHGYDKIPYPGEENVLILSQSDGSYKDASDQLNNPVLGFSHSCTIGDIDNDKDIDIIIVDIWGGEVGQAINVLVNDGTGNFSSRILKISSLSNSVWTSSELVDLNNDDLLDLVLGSAGPGSTSVVLWNPGDGNYGTDYTDLPLVESYPITTDILPIDFNNDGFKDLILAKTKDSPFYEGSFYQVLINNTSKGFLVETKELFIDHNYRSNWIMRMEAVDIDLDGDLDIISLYDLADTTKTELIWLNDGDGIFSLLHLPENMRGTMIPIDIDADGDKDFLVLSVPFFGNNEQVHRWITVINNSK